MELREKLQIHTNNGFNVSDYILKAKTLSVHLVLYILNGLGPWHLTSMTTFNMNQICPSVWILHNQLKSYERMLLVFKGMHQEYVVQENVTHFNRENHVLNNNNNRSNGNFGS